MRSSIDNYISSQSKFKPRQVKDAALTNDWYVVEERAQLQNHKEKTKEPSTNHVTASLQVCLTTGM